MVIAGVMNWGAWGADLDEKQMAQNISDLVENDINTFDHADIYGGYTTERTWGNAWKSLDMARSNIKVISKCGIMYPCDERPEIDIKHYDYTKKHIISSVEKSIENLQCDYLDTLLLHRPSPIMDMDEIFAAYEYLINAQMILSIGVSNFTPSQMELLLQYIPIDFNQIEISFFQLDPFTNGSIDYCYRKGIQLQSWSPLGGGDLFTNHSNPNQIDLLQRLSEVASKYNWSLDEMTYFFLNHHPAGIDPVVGSSKPSRVVKAKEALDVNITDKQWFEIWTACTGHKVA